MIRDITIGQYYPQESIIHKLDPRTKFIATFIFIILIFVSNNFVHYGVLAVFVAIMIFLSKIPVTFMIKGLRPLLFLMIFALIINVFFTKGQVIFHWWKITITLEGLIQAGLMILRLTLLVMGSSILTLSTSPIQITDAIESLASPLKRFGFPAHEMAMMMSIALRFIPTLLEETDKIMKAQMARGADFESGNLFKRIKNMIPILIPLFISAFNRADDLASAMEARCYRGGVGRTKLNPLVYERRDGFGFLAVGLLVFVVFLLRFR